MPHMSQLKWFLVSMVVSEYVLKYYYLITSTKESDQAFPLMVLLPICHRYRLLNHILYNFKKFELVVLKSLTECFRDN